MPQRKTKQFWKDPKLLDLLKKQREMFRRSSNNSQSQDENESREHGEHSNELLGTRNRNADSKAGHCVTR